jgi:hypothetical protein
MNSAKKWVSSGWHVVLFATILYNVSPAMAATAPPLGTAQTFAVLAGSTITNTGATVVTGDLGVSSPGVACTGFVGCTTTGPGTVTGAIHVGDVVANAAQADALLAYNELIGQACNFNYLPATNIGGLTLAPGVHCFPSSAGITGTVTLSGGPTDVYVFKIGSTLITAANASVLFPTGAASNVYWAVGSSATLGTGTALIGNVLAVASITLTTGATVTGRSLAGAAVTMDTNTVTLAPTPPPVTSAVAPSLGTAATFAVLGGSTVTNTGATTVIGDLGVSSPGVACTGLVGCTTTGPGTVVGTIHVGDALANTAQADALLAYNQLVGQACKFNYPAITDIGGLTLSPGVHCFASSVGITGTVTLGGGPTDVYVFKIGSTLTTAANASVVFPTGVGSNVFWAVGSAATLGTGTALTGNILAVTSITLTTGATVSGSSLARAAVTMDTNTVATTSIFAPRTAGTGAVVPSLGAAATFAVLGGSTVTNIGATIVTGDLGVSSPGVACTGFVGCTTTGPGKVVGAIHVGDPLANLAQSDTLLAYHQLVAQPCNFNYPPITNIGGLTLTPGVHCFPSSVGVTGTVTLSGGPTDVYVFKVGSTLTTAANASVVFPTGVGGNVFWAVGSSATLGTGTAFTGNILAVASITLTTRATVSGRSLAGAAVTMDTNNAAPTFAPGLAIAPALGTAAAFAILGGSTVTNTGATIVTGDLGVSSPGVACTGFVGCTTTGPGTVTGAIHVADALADVAQSDAVLAYNQLLGQGCNFNYPPITDIGGLTLTPGVHCFPSSVGITGTVTLSGGPTDVYVFKIGSTLTTAANAAVVFPTGAGGNVFWAVGSSATLGTGTTFIGNILAVDSITLTTGANVSGRSLARAAVTMDTNNAVAAVAVAGLAVAPSLGTATTFAVLAGSTVTNTGATIVTGNLGVSTPGVACTGFVGCTTTGPGKVTGAIHVGDALAKAAQIDALLAYNQLVGEACNFSYPPITDIGGLTLSPGVHCFPSSVGITGTVTLSGGPTDVYVFKIGSTLTTAASAAVVFPTGAGSNVYWAVGSSATLGTGTTFIGNVLAVASITLTTGANVSGRSLARAAVTMDTNNAVAPIVPAGSGAIAPALGTAATFAVLGGSTVTNTGATIVTGDLGVSSPGVACTGFVGCTTTGLGTVVGTIHVGDAVANSAQSDALLAYNQLIGQACNFNYPAITDIGGLTLSPGVHCFPSSVGITGTVTLSGGPTDVYIFKIGSTLTTASNALVVFPTGVGTNVFWAVGSSATLGTGTIFTGNILAVASITMTTGATVSARALARAAVTMDTNIVAPTSVPGLAVAPALGAAAPFAVLGGTTVTNVGVSLVTGNLGVSTPGLTCIGFVGCPAPAPALAAVKAAGLRPAAGLSSVASLATVTGPGTVAGTIHVGDATADSAQVDALLAYNQLVNQGCNFTYPPITDIGGLTFSPGVHCFPSSVILTGKATLSGGPSDVYIFKIGSTLTTAINSSVVFPSGVDTNVFWAVGSSATLGTGTAFTGNILAGASITLTTGATVSGRALAGVVVAMDTNTVAPQCPSSGCPHPLPLPPRPKVVTQVVLDHFQCYEVRPANNIAPRQVRLQDQFGTRTVTLRHPQMICAPTVATTLPNSSVGIFPDDLRNPIDQLVCYRIGESGGSNIEVSMDNQFGSQLLIVKNARLLCVPSIKTVP